MSKKNLFQLLLSGLVLALVSCSDYPGFKKTDNGLYYKFHVENEDAPKPVLGDAIIVNMIYKIYEKDSVVFNSKDFPEPSKLIIVSPSYNGDICEGLAMMAEGDSASFIVCADSFFLKNVKLEKLPPFIKSGVMLTFDIKLLSIQKKADFEKEQQLKQEKIKVLIEERRIKEPELIKKYVEDNKITVKPTKTGLYFIDIVKGTGAKAEIGKTVFVNYVSRLLDGTVVDSSLKNTPLQILLGAKEAIPGWEEGILHMRVGGKAKFVVPSAIAYGEKNVGQIIPPYSTLVYEVELINVK